MKEAFKKLDASRQMEILNAALGEFAAYGYEDASTNRIVKNAGMSKGMLYYYFENKADVYYTCTEYTLNKMKEELVNWQMPKQGFIERSAVIAKKKSRYYKAHPEISMFLTRIYVQGTVPDAYRGLLDEIVSEGYDAAYRNIDFSYFRDDIPHDTLMKLITWTIDGYAGYVEEAARDNIEAPEDLEYYFNEFDAYLEAMRKLYYKEEYQ